MPHIVPHKAVNNDNAPQERANTQQYQETCNILKKKYKCDSSENDLSSDFRVRQSLI